MSHDEEMAVIGRMTVERKKLEQRGSALQDEAQRIATGLAALAQELTTNSSIYTKDFLHLTQDQIGLLDAPKLTELLKDIESTGKRYHDLRVRLHQAGLGEPIQY
jgi:hypothetical protein